MNPIFLSLECRYSKICKCVFFDDMDKDLDEARKVNDVMVVDRKEFKNWEDLL